MYGQASRRQRHPLDLLTHGPSLAPIANQRALETMPRVDKRSRRMKYTVTGAASLASGALHTPLESAVFERKNIQPVTAKIGRKQMPPHRIEQKRMRMRRRL